MLHILTPLLDYREEERIEWAVHAYRQLSRLTDLKRFYKYMDYIDKYANIKEDERELVLNTLEQKEDTIMIREALLEEGRAEGLTKGRAEGLTKGLTKGRAEGLTKGLTKGRAEGRTEGIIIAIHQVQKVKGLSLTPRSILETKTHKQLQSIHKKLLER